MATFARVLIKLGHDGRFKDWMVDTVPPLSYSTFASIMQGPGAPVYSCHKTTTEKWLMLRSMGFVHSAHKNDAGEVYILDPAQIRDYIDVTMPPKIKSDPAKRYAYLHGGIQ